MLIKLRDGVEIPCKDIILDNRDMLVDGRYLIPLASVDKIEEEEIE